jgi:SPP1 family predicted phage head-tail adaptor
MTNLLGPKGSYTVQAGRFRHRVTLQKQSSGRDSAGGVVTLWTNFAVGVPAAISPVSGREILTAQQIAADVSTEIAIRWRPGVDETMRVLHNDETYGIVSVIADGDSGRKVLTLSCTRRKADGFRDG